jgi:folate-binding protein YgfZ
MNDNLSFIYQNDLVVTEIKGDDFIDLFNRLSTNNIPNQKNLITDSIFTNENGRFIDIVSVWNTTQYALMISNSLNHQNLLNWIDKFTFEEDISISSPLKKKVISIFSNNKNNDLNIFGEINKNEIINRKMGGIEIILSNTSFFNDYKIINLILDDDSKSIESIESYLNSQDIFQMEDSEFNSFRIKNRIPTCGNEIVSSYNPLEIGISHMIDFNKGCYVGQEVIARLDTYDKVQRKLMILDNKKDFDIISSKGCDVTTSDDEYCLAVVKKNISSLGR